MAETSGLLNRRRGITPTEGSNPSVSATFPPPHLRWGWPFPAQASAASGLGRAGASAGKLSSSMVAAAVFEIGM